MKKVRFHVTRHTPVRRLLLMLVLPVLALLIYSCAEVERPVAVPALRNVTVNLRHVRVLVGTGTKVEPLVVAARQKVDVYQEDGRTFMRSVVLSGAKVTSAAGAVIIDGWNTGRASVGLVPQEGDYVAVGKYAYAGAIALVTRGDSVMAINYVDMEDYVAGVASCEMVRLGDHAAYEAQAVAARTYALFTMAGARLFPYDLRDDTSSQVYRGVTDTSAAGRRGAQRTAGVVMFLDDWRILPAYYFSTCGGHTAPPSQMRGAPLLAPLGPVPCEYCRHSPRYRWSIAVPAAEMETILVKAGYVTGNLTEVRVVETISGGWVDRMEVESTGGMKPLTGYAFRQNVGTSKLYSTNFAVTRSGDKYIIEGRGFGHGVGMCQFGADGMARQGHNYAEILKHYYAGARIVKIY